MSLTLYNYVLSGNCYKIRLMAALLDVEYETVAVDFFPGFEHRSEAMLALNPAGTLPILVANDLVLTETQAILSWLAQEFDTTGRWLPQARLSEVLEWLAYANRLTSSAGLARLHDMLNWPCDGANAKADAERDLRILELHLNDRVLDGSTWLVGDNPTIADIACFPYVALSPDAGLEHDGFPAIRHWLYEIRSLPGFVTMPGIHHLHELNEPSSE